MADGRLRIGLGQGDFAVGDINANVERALAYVEQAKAAGVSLLLLPELAISGYPPEDLLLSRKFLADCEQAVERLAQASDPEMTVLVGYPSVRGRHPHNSMAVVANGAVQAVYHKNRLPTYGVFDEDRYFQSGRGGAVIDVGGVRVGLTICEDIWYEQPLADEALAGAELICNISASPYERGKAIRREALVSQRARDHLCAVAYCNLVGGQDELVFDGGSLVCDHRGRLLARAEQFSEQLLVCEIPIGPIRGARLHDTRYRQAPEPSTVSHLATLPARRTTASPQTAEVAPVLSDEQEVYEALVLATRDYVRKNGFDSVLLGLSGGIDSALVALIACDALGADKVHCVVMPSRYSSTGTQQDARDLANALGAHLHEMPIAGVVDAYEQTLADEFRGCEPDVAEENLQARTRGNLLMALSNKFGWLLLSTGNKSEMSVGYATLYGDMAGGFAVLKDVPKLLVFALTRWRASQDEPQLVPEQIITRPPSAELRPDQADTDSLPPYEVLDPILARYVEEDESAEDIIDAGFDEQVVRRVLRMTDLAEYKRRQAPPGPKVTSRAFGRDRRRPITSLYRG